MLPVGTYFKKIKYSTKIVRVVVPPPASNPLETAVPAPVYPLKTLAPTPLESLHNGTRQSTSSTNTSDYFSMNSRENNDYHHQVYTLFKKILVDVGLAPTSKVDVWV